MASVQGLYREFVSDFPVNAFGYIYIYIYVIYDAPNVQRANGSLNLSRESPEKIKSIIISLMKLMVETLSRCRFP